MANQVRPEDESFSVVVCGKKGHGKSTVCNALLGSDTFPVGTPTETAGFGEVTKKGLRIKVVDTPDISTEETKKKEKEAEVAKWKEFVSPEASCLLLVIRSDAPYTEEDFVAYRQVRRFWGKSSAREKLVVVFTCSEGQDVEEVGERMEAESPKWIAKVLTDSGGRYIVFKGKNSGDLLADVVDDCKDDSDSEDETDEQDEDKKGKGKGKGRRRGSKDSKEGKGKGKGKGKGRGQRQGHGKGLGRGHGKGKGGGGGGGGKDGFLCCLLALCCKPK